jgi:hypothetical protein
VNCNSRTTTGEATSETSSTLTVIHLWSNCNAFGLINATVNPGSCHTLWHLTSAETAKSDIVCTKEGDAITIKALSALGNCQVKVGAQPERAHVIFFNKTVNGIMEFVAEQTLEVIASVTESNGICPVKAGVHNNAEMPGVWTIRGATVS